MAQHYEPDKIIQLIQLCSWRERTEMSQGGLIELAGKLAPGQELNDRYIVDLLSDARKGLKEEKTIKKNETHMTLLLKHAGFNHWDEWKSALRTPGNFLSPENDHFDVSEEKPLTIMVPQLLQKQLIPTLTFVKKSSQVEVLSSSEETLIELAKYAGSLLDKSSLIICALPLSWKDQAVKMRQPSWGDFSGTKRILPVWVDLNDTWNPVAPFLPSVKQEQSGAGLPGILTGLLFVENFAMQDSKWSENPAPENVRSNGPQFHNSPVGFYLQGATIHNLVTGGDQVINNNFD